MGLLLWCHRVHLHIVYAVYNESVWLVILSCFGCLCKEMFFLLRKEKAIASYSFVCVCVCIKRHTADLGLICCLVCKQSKVAKIQLWALLFCVRQSVSGRLWTKPACVAEDTLPHESSFFCPLWLLTNMPAPWGVQIGSKNLKYFCFRADNDNDNNNGNL